MDGGMSQKIALKNLAITLSTVNWFAKFFTIINKMKFIRNLKGKFSPYIKYVAAVPSKNRTSEIDANCTVNTTKHSSY